MTNNEHTIAIVSFEGAIKREVRRVREEMKKCERVSELYLEINASGRIEDGDVKIEYQVGQSSYDSSKVRGDSLQACLDEFLRRHGWQQVHNPKAIGYEKIPSDDSE